MLRLGAAFDRPITPADAAVYSAVLRHAEKTVEDLATFSGARLYQKVDGEWRPLDPADAGKDFCGVVVVSGRHQGGTHDVL